MRLTPLEPRSYAKSNHKPSPTKPPWLGFQQFQGSIHSATLNSQDLRSGKICAAKSPSPRSWRWSWRWILLNLFLLLQMSIFVTINVSQSKSSKKNCLAILGHSIPERSSIHLCLLCLHQKEYAVFDPHKKGTRTPKRLEPLVPPSPVSFRG